MSTVELKEVFNYYIGVRARVTYEDGEIREWMVDSVNTWLGYWGTNLLSKEEQDIEVYLEDVDHGDKIQLFLNRFDDLPHERQLEYHRLCGEYGTDTPESVLWLFKNQVDCFDLIERGLAIVKQEECEFCKGTGKRLKMDGSKGITKCLVCKGTGFKKTFNAPVTATAP